MKYTLKRKESAFEIQKQIKNENNVNFKLLIDVYIDIPLITTIAKPKKVEVLRFQKYLNSRIPKFINIFRYILVFSTQKFVWQF